MTELDRTVELLARAWAAVESSGIPESLWPAAFPLAFAEVRGDTSGARPSGSGASTGDNGATGRTKKASSGSGTSGSPVLADLPNQEELFERIAAETDVSVEDLADVFYVTDGKLHLKVASKDLGDNTRASVMTVTSLLTGVVFAGTDHKSLPINEVHDVCRLKRCFHEKNASRYVQATPSVATFGSSRAVEITHKSGWQDEFANAVGRVFPKGDGDD